MVDLTWQQYLKDNSTFRTLNGENFIATHRIPDFGDGETTYYAIRTADDAPTVVQFDMNVEGKVRVDFYEDASVTDDGSAGTPVFIENLNRSTDSDTSTDVEFLRDVSVDSDGDRIATGGAGGSKNGGVTQTSPATVLGSPWVLKSNTTYVYEVENVSGDTIDLNPNLGFHVRKTPLE